jgi:hypothetical protein
MTPDEMRARYRQRCEYARKGHVIYLNASGALGDVYKTFMRAVTVDGKKVEIPAINAAKRWVRENAPFNTFTV